MASAFRRTFLFGAHTNAQERQQQQQQLGESEARDDADDSVGSTAAPTSEPELSLSFGLVRSLERTFGLDVCVDSGLFTLRKMEKRFRKQLRAECLHWRKLFKRSPAAPASTTKKRSKKRRRGEQDAAETPIGGGGGRLPVKLEICAGFGEWVVAQAKAERGVANWAALELRYDRCHSIFSRMVFEGCENLAILGGDAAQILPVKGSGHIRPDSVDHVFVNFPEPPQTDMHHGAESQLHLLTAEFFRAIHRVLRTGGRLTILHDEYRYCCLLARTVAALNAGGGSAAESGGGDATPSSSTDGASPRLYESVLGLRGKGMTKEDWEEVAGAGGIRLYHGVPGKKSGHAVQATSYFDQLWMRNKGADRFFLALAKC